MVRRRRSIPGRSQVSLRKLSPAARVMAFRKLQSNPGVVKGVIDLSGGSAKSSSVFPGARNKSSTSSNNKTDLQIEALGRLMTRILRHQANELGLNIREDGYCRVADLLKISMNTRDGLSLRDHSVEDVLKAVEQDSKKRFSTSVNKGHLYIRANQGHSMKDVVTEKLLQEIHSAKEIPVCVHGTYKKNLSSIRRTGLCTMGRNHVHFATGLPKDGAGAVVSGMRATCDALIFLDVEQALKDGMRLHKSENDVVLTEGFQGVVPPRYFARIIEWPSTRVL